MRRFGRLMAAAWAAAVVAGVSAGSAAASPVASGAPTIPHFRSPLAPGHAAGPAAAAGQRPDGAGSPDLEPGQELTGGQSLVDGSMTFTLGKDGNLVLDDAGHAVWATGKTGYSGAYLIMQKDGNLVEYAGGKAIWSSGTAGHPGAYCALSSIGEPAVYLHGKTLWRTPYPNTYFAANQQDVLFPGQSLGAPGQTMYDATSTYSFYEYGGYLQEYLNGTHDLLWSAGSSCSGTSKAVMQPDGNFVIYCNGAATWSSGTGGHPRSYGMYLHLQADGNVVIYSNYGRAFWSNGG
jgi:hypothetical protein